MQCVDHTMQHVGHTTPGGLEGHIAKKEVLNPIRNDILRFRAETMPQRKRKRKRVPNLHPLEANRVNPIHVGSTKTMPLIMGKHLGKLEGNRVKN